MVAYFKIIHLPDVDRIYTCSHSSGAIFSFALALNRSDVFAAAVPVSGQMALHLILILQGWFPNRAFNGKDDATVVYSAALNNINIWANKGRWLFFFRCCNK